MKKPKRSKTQSGSKKIAGGRKRPAKRVVSRQAPRRAAKPAARSRTRALSRTRPKAPARTRAHVAAKSVVRTVATPAERTLRQPRLPSMEKALTRIAAKAAGSTRAKSHKLEAARPLRRALPARGSNRQLLRLSRAPQFTYMKAPGADTGFEVGDTVEVFCDHERDSERVRGWIRGVVVQVDNKLVAVQFRSNVFLTDGWMVPDRILWYSLGSDQIRAAGLGKRGARRPISDY